jgi:hypothetical protein
MYVIFMVFNEHLMQKKTWGITFWATLVQLHLPNNLFPCDFPIKTVFAVFTFLMHATHPIHCIFCDVITLIIFGEQYML